MTFRLHRIAVLAVALVAIAGIVSSCAGKGPEKEGEIYLSVVNAVTGPDAGSQFVTVEAGCDWTIAFREECTWATLSKASGSGNGHLTLSWEANDGGSARSIVIEARTPSGKYRATCEFVQEAKGAGPVNTSLNPDPVGRWMEIPVIEKDDRRFFFTHDMTVGKYAGRNYSLLLDIDAKIAVWVAYPLNKGLIGNGSRTNQWGLDPKVPRQYQSVIFSGYKGGYERGHQIPSADRYSANESTFYGTNMTPQRGELNENAWASLEGSVRTWANQFDTLYVVTGADIIGSDEVAYDNEGKVITVPVGYFKALLGYKKGGTLGITGSTGGYTAIGFYFEHRYYQDSAIMGSQAMTIDELERKTGFDFFANLPSAVGADVASKVEATRDNWWWNSIR